MKLKALPVVIGLLTIFVISHTASALDQLPLPDSRQSAAQVQIAEFANTDTNIVRVASATNTIRPCDALLRATETKISSEKIKAIKAYRHCRSSRALQQLAVWRWQENFN